MAKGPFDIISRPLTSEDCELSIVMQSKTKEAGQIITNLQPDFPEANITITDDMFEGKETKKIELKTGNTRLNIQNELLQLQPQAEVDVSHLWPKDTKLVVDYDINGPLSELRPLSGEGILYWVIELDQSINEDKIKKFNQNSIRADLSGFNLSESGKVIFKPVSSVIELRGTKSGLFRTRDFLYDELLGNHTPNMDLARGRSSDVITCTTPR